jgi:hypothetical protein
VANFLKQVLEECPYTIEIWYTNNGTESKGNPKTHAFAKLCQVNMEKLINYFYPKEL